MLYMKIRKYILTESELRSFISEAVKETLACLGATYTRKVSHLAHAVKSGDPEAIDTASLLLSRYVPPRSVLIPIPSHDGHATYTLKLAKFIAKRTGAKVLDILKTDARESLYMQKQKGVDIDYVDLGYWIMNTPEIGEILKSAKNVILVDNVVDSGVTYEQAQKVIKLAYHVDAWMLSLGAVQGSKYDPDEKRVIRSTFDF